MNTRAIFLASFIASIVVVIIGAYLKITHSPSSDYLLIIGIIVSAIFIVIGIYEVNASRRIDRAEKVLWTIGFLFMSGITGLVYFVAGRKRIVPAD